MKKYLILLLMLPVLLEAQTGYVEVDHNIYPFLERMERLNLIQNYDVFEIPKTRREISSYLIELSGNKEKLIDSDKRRLIDFLNEFEFDINRTTENYTSLFSENSIEDHFSQKEKFIYFYEDSSRANIFLNFVANGINIYKHDSNLDENKTSTLFNFGGILRGSFLDNFGFFIKATNGSYFGDKDLARTYEGLRYNYKLTRFQEGIGNEYYDETEGYFAVDYDFIRFKIGRDRVRLGQGIIKTVLSDNSPPMDYLHLGFKYKAFTFSHYHGKLLGSDSLYIDPVQEGIKTVADKYFVYHRFGVKISNHLSLGVGEVIIYANRNMDLSYLNPFNFYKSIEHINQDRDNSLLFFDISNNSISGLKLYATLLIDDINFGQLGTKWYGNQTVLEAGASTSLFYNYVPIDAAFQFIRVDPYVYTHRIKENNYSSLGFPLVGTIQPNSSNFIFKLDYFPLNRLDVSFKYVHTIHGANEYDTEGNLLVNHGGEFEVGHRVGDSENAGHLDGILEYSNSFELGLRYEPIKNIVISGMLSIVDRSLILNRSEAYVQSILGLGVKL
ncbi:MAG: hypothetical protein K8F36_02990 [Melioribacteraceae bacterium]|nr:hypothetical protein [Melioribacteraceae bacterium]